MCGIAGIFAADDPSCAPETAERMAAAIAYRGPDGAGAWHDELAALAHRRLAVLDLSAAASQPMVSTDGDAVLVFNGEIYNFHELAAELAAAGTHFRSTGDTEVILALYQRYGAAAIRRLDGMFALALYDRRKRTLLLARDRLGKKPLFYFQQGPMLVFASELSALKRHPAMPRELDLTAIHDYLSFEYVPGTNTVYRGVFRLPPGCIGKLRAGSTALQIERYWQPDFSVKSAAGAAALQEELAARMERSVTRRLIADVPCGVFLSGGVDSGIVAALAARSAERPLTLFTAGFADARYDERAAAAATAAKLQQAHPGIAVRTAVIDPCDFSLLEKLARHYGEPFADLSCIPVHQLSAFAAQSVKVVLAGDGGDELFGGYERYAAMALAAHTNWLPRSFKRFAARWFSWLPDRGKRGFTTRWRRFWELAALPENRRYFAVAAQVGEAEKRSLYGERMRSAALPESAARITAALERAAARDPVERCSEVDLTTYLVGDILTKVDVAAMAVSLEVRSPWLDTGVVEFAAALPWCWKQRGLERKRLLRRYGRSLLPPVVLNGRKRGFAVPAGAWFRGPWRAELQTRLLEGRLVTDGWMEKSALAKVLAAHQAYRADKTELLSALLMLELFLEEERSGT